MSPTISPNISNGERKSRKSETATRKKQQIPDQPIEALNYDETWDESLSKIEQVVNFRSNESYNRERLKREAIAQLIGSNYPSEWNNIPIPVCKVLQQSIDFQGLADSRMSSLDLQTGLLHNAVLTIADWHQKTSEYLRVQLNAKMHVDFEAHELSMHESLEKAKSYTDNKKASTLVEVQHMLD